MENTVSSSPVQPFLKWAGSKRKLIPELSRFWNNSYNRYVEPFAGSACLFFNIAPKAALLGDINKDLISTYEEIKNNVDNVLMELKTLKRSKEDYYKIRESYNQKLSSTKKAARFIYLNRFCFNGLYRTNSLGKFNVPYCGDERGSMPDETVFRKCAKILQSADLHAGTFDQVLKKLKRSDFVYMDPPYSVRSGEIFNEYDRSKFSRDDIKLLRSWMIELNERNISFLVSYADSEESNYLRKGFHHKQVSVRRSIAGFAAHRRRVNEVMIFNNL